MLGLLGDSGERDLGVAAVDGGRVVAFLAPLACRLWGRPAVYIPEWGQAADADTVSRLYDAAALRWVEAGRTVHVVTMWAHEAGVEEAWHRLGFGRVVVDVLRDLTPLGSGAGAIPVRRAGPEDAEVVARLQRALWDYLAAPPTCRVHPVPGGGAEVAARLTDPARPVWIAGPGLAFLSIQPGADAPAALGSPALVRGGGAFVSPGVRRQGVGTALLETALGWARDAGFAGCTLDFESANRAAAHFWPKAGFRPVLHSLGRQMP